MINLNEQPPPGFSRKGKGNKKYHGDHLGHDFKQKRKITLESFSFVSFCYLKRKQQSRHSINQRIASLTSLLFGSTLIGTRNVISFLQLKNKMSLTKIKTVVVPYSVI